MSYVGLLTTVNLYKTQKADLTGELSNILMNITRSSRKSTELMQQETEQKSQIREDYMYVKADDETETHYQVRCEDGQDKLDQIEQDFELQIQKINTWEAELEFQKQTKETQVQVTGSYLDSFTEALKNNIKKDFTYGQGK